MCQWTSSQSEKTTQIPFLKTDRSEYASEIWKIDPREIRIAVPLPDLIGQN